MPNGQRLAESADRESQNNHLEPPQPTRGPTTVSSTQTIPSRRSFAASAPAGDLWQITCARGARSTHTRKPTLVCILPKFSQISSQSLLREKKQASPSKTEVHLGSGATYGMAGWSPLPTETQMPWEHPPCPLPCPHVHSWCRHNVQRKPRRHQQLAPADS